MLRRDTLGVGSNLLHAHSCPCVVETTCSSPLVLGWLAYHAELYVVLMMKVTNIDGGPLCLVISLGSTGL